MASSVGVEGDVNYCSSSSKSLEISSVRLSISSCEAMVEGEACGDGSDPAAASIRCTQIGLLCDFAKSCGNCAITDFADCRMFPSGVGAEAYREVLLSDDWR